MEQVLVRHRERMPQAPIGPLVKASKRALKRAKVSNGAKALRRAKAVEKVL
jgi:hypothetical protein